MSVEERMQQFVERMYAGEVARPGDLRGCSAAEITALEQRYDVILPRSYALFLSHMGRAAGKLWNLGEFDLLYRDALQLTEETLESWQRSGTESSRYSAAAFPHHGLVFCERLGNPDYWLIVCEGQDDSPVIHFDYEQEPIRFEQTQPSLFGFLEELCGDAEHWIRNGMM
jgi:hypothetical protein